MGKQTEKNKEIPEDSDDVGEKWREKETKSLKFKSYRNGKRKQVNWFCLGLLLEYLSKPKLFSFSCLFC